MGRGKAAVIYLVRNTMTREIQLWKCIHNRNYDASGEHAVLNMLQGHDNIQKVFHGDDTNDMMVLRFANGGDLHSYGLDNFGATRQYMPEIFLWHFMKSMVAALAYCHAGWKDGEPFVAKEGWRAVIHGDLVTGNILLHWHHSEMLPQLILTDFGDARLLDEMPPPCYDFMLQALRSRDPTASHLKHDLQTLGGNFQSMLVLPLFGGNANKMQEEHNVDLAFDFARQQSKLAFSPRLAEWVDKLAHNEKTGKGTKFANALEFAKELVPVADCKIAELSGLAAELPGRQFLPLSGQDDSNSFQAPLGKDVRAFVDYYAENAFAGIPGLRERHRKGELDPEFETYRAISKAVALDEKALHRLGRRSSVTGNMELNTIDPLSGTFIIKIEETHEGPQIEVELGGDGMVKGAVGSEKHKKEADMGKAGGKSEEVNNTDASQPAGVEDEVISTFGTERGEAVPTMERSGKRKDGFSDPQSTEPKDATPNKRSRTTSATTSAAANAATTRKEA